MNSSFPSDRAFGEEPEAAIPVSGSRSALARHTIETQWAEWLAEHKKPETAESYQRSAIEETR